MLQARAVLATLFSLDSAKAALLDILHVHKVCSERHWASLFNWHVRYRTSAVAL
jgi:hypothetical protein